MFKVQVCISSNQDDAFTQTNHLRSKLSVHFVKTRSTCYELMFRDKERKWNKNNSNKTSVVKSSRKAHDLKLQASWTLLQIESESTGDSSWVRLLSIWYVRFCEHVINVDRKKNISSLHRVSRVNCWRLEEDRTNEI